MLQTLLLSADAATTPAGFDLTSILMLVAMGVFLYFFMIRPQNKRRKQEDKMRSSLQVGDEIVTVGGIVGRVVSIKDDSLLIESGSDRTKIRIKKVAVASVTPLKLDE